MIDNEKIEAIFEYLEKEDNCNVGDEILAEGHPIVYREKDTPKGCIIKEYPNGRIELIKVDMYSNNDEVIKVIRDGK